MDEFKLQFQPANIVAGSMRINEGFGRKHYVSSFIQGRTMIHTSAKEFKTATEARDYANAIVGRYRNLAQAALMNFVESQDVEPTN